MHENVEAGLAPARWRAPARDAPTELNETTGFGKFRRLNSAPVRTGQKIATEERKRLVPYLSNSCEITGDTCTVDIR